MRFAVVLFLLSGLAAGGCESPAVQLGPSTMPAWPTSQPVIQLGPTSVPAGLVEVKPGAFVFQVHPGAFTVNAQTAPLPDTIFNRLWLWMGIAAVLSVVGYWANHWAREWWTRK